MPWPFSRRRNTAAPPKAGNGVRGVRGTNLTLYYSLRGARPQQLNPPPRVEQSAGHGFAGTRLTRHMDNRGRIRELPAVRAVSPLKRVGLGVLGALKWMFSLKVKILIIERYIWGECLGNFILGATGFTFFMIITSVFSLGEKIFQKNIPPFTVAKVLLLSAPAFLVLAIPVAVVFSTLMAMGRLNRDNEMMAFTTNGISLYRVFIPFVALAVMAAGLTWTIYERVVPPNNQEYKEVLKVFWQAQVVDFIKPGIIIKAPQRKYFYVDSINKTEGIMYGLRLYDYFQGETKPMRNFPRIFVASQAWVENQFLVLNDVVLYNLDQNQGDTLVSAQMPEIRIDIGTRVSEYSIQPHPTELTTTELRNRLQFLRDRLEASAFVTPQLQANYFSNWTEYYFKYAIPFACIALVLVAVPVSLTGPRDERNLGIIMTFGLVMVYYIVFFVSRTLGSRGIVVSTDLQLFGHKLIEKGTNLFPPYIAGWTPSAVFLIAALILIIRARK
jgi:lipopolysaccharide export LptBFGC system permease protein LptF